MSLPTVQSAEIIFDTLDKPITNLVYTGANQWIWQEFNSGNADTLDNYFLNVSIPTLSTNGYLYVTFVDTPSQTPILSWLSQWRLDSIPTDQVTTLGFSRFPEHFRLDVQMIPHTKYFFGMSGTVPVAWANTADGFSARLVANYITPEPQTWITAIVATIAMTAIIIAKVKR